MPKRLTKEEFIERATKVHNGKYDYSKVEYINNRTKVCIICPVHGEFWQSPNQHTDAKQECPKCSNDRRRDKLRYTKEEFVRKAKKVHNEKYDYSKVEYINNHTKVCIVCPTHGEFWQVPDSHLSGHDCPQCGHNKHKSLVEGVGVYDKYGVSEDYIYELWRGMIKRCYNKEALKTHPTYSGCSVCEEWKFFSNFELWVNNNYVEGWCLDKDILSKDTKIYSPDTCCFVPQEINGLFRCNVFEETKKLKGREYAEKYKSQLDERVYNALIHY